MSWRDRLANASFRGVTFLTENHDAKLGRRLVVHEFPGAELPLIEDFGAKAAELHVTAYFIGENYDLARNNFLVLLQKPGADWLVHPWLGRIEVRARDWSITESNDKNGFCSISIDFVPAGTVISQTTVNANDQAAGRLTTLGASARSMLALARMATEGISGFISAASGQLDGLRTAMAVASLPLTWSQQVARLVQGIKGDFTDLLSIPEHYTSALHAVYGVIGSAVVDPEPDNSQYAAPLATSSVLIVPDSYRPRVIAQLARLCVAQPINKALLTVPVEPNTPLEVSANLEKNKALNVIFMIEAAGRLALGDFTDAGTRDTVVNDLLSAIDFIVPKLPDTLFQAALDARVALLDALLTQDLFYSQSRTVIKAMPATVLAHRFERDETVFKAMNGVRHPLFVQGVIYG